MEEFSLKRYDHSLRLTREIYNFWWKPCSRELVVLMESLFYPTTIGCHLQSAPLSHWRSPVNRPPTSAGSSDGGTSPSIAARQNNDPVQVLYRDLHSDAFFPLREHVYTERVMDRARVGICCLLGNYAAFIGNYSPPFRDNLSVPSSRSCTETSVRNYHFTLRNNPEELRYHLLCGGCLKLRVPWSVLQ